MGAGGVVAGGKLDPGGVSSGTTLESHLDLQRNKESVEGIRQK